VFTARYGLYTSVYNNNCLVSLSCLFQEATLNKSFRLYDTVRVLIFLIGEGCNVLYNKGTVVPAHVIRAH
jgi:hypothetical protein